MKNIKKMICFLIVTALLTVVFVSCAQDEGSGTPADPDSPGVVDDDDGEEPANPRERYNPNFAPVDMGGYVFQIGTRDDSGVWHVGGVPIHTRDLFAEQMTGDLINDAVFRRNSYIEEKFNMRIEMITFPESVSESLANEMVERSARAGDKSFDLLMTHMHIGFQTATRGVLHDLAAFPNIDLSKPYWNDGATRGGSVGHRLFVGLSDLSFSTNESLYCMFFNKNMLEDYALENPYKLVQNNQWTFDTFNRMIRHTYLDLNGSGMIDIGDQFGYASSSAVNFIWAGGSHIMTKDALDIPVLDFNTPRTLSVFNWALEMTNNPYTWAVDQWWIEGPLGIFQDGRALFYSSKLERVNELRAVEFDFGIIPYPKYDSAQENFYSFVDGHASMMAIPILLPNPEWTGMIIEELSFLSFRDILPVYKDVVLGVKLVRDEESVEMLEILFDSKVFDPSYVLGGGFWIMWFELIRGPNTDFVSTFERREASLVRDIERRVELLLAVEEF